jgi:XTP/dITP diphosphohydrolase
MKLLIATRNPAKKNELERGLNLFIPDGQLITLDDLGITLEPEETGESFESNARLKADYYSKRAGLPTVADDGGIMIDALGGEPGVHSKRWLGRDATDQELIDYTLRRMKGVPPEKRTARFTTVLCFMDPALRRTITVSESLEGMIAETQTTKWQHGFPYRAIFKIKDYDTYYDELTEQQHEMVNHRLKAIRRLAKQLQDQYMSHIV